MSRRGRILITAGLATVALSAVAVAETVAGQPPPHPTEGKWKGHTAEHANVSFGVGAGHVHDFYTGARGFGITFDSAQINHGHFTGHDNDGISVTGTFQRPEHDHHHSRHLVGTLYVPGGSRPVRIGFRAHIDDTRVTH